MDTAETNSCTRQQTDAIITDRNLTQHVHETTRKNNILDLVIYTEEELIVNLKITDKIGDHQAITVAIKIEKGNILIISTVCSHDMSNVGNEIPRQS